MLGYMTEREALAHGFTHHGKYFGIPVWLGNIDNDDFMVATKWFPMEYLMTACHHVEGFIASVFYPNAEPAFQFSIGQPIDTARGQRE